MMSRLGTWTLLGADLADGIQLTLFTGSVRKPRNGQQKTDKQKWSAVRLAPRVNKPLRGTSPSWREKGEKKEERQEEIVECGWSQTNTKRPDDAVGWHAAARRRRWRRHGAECVLREEPSSRVVGLPRKKASAEAWRRRYRLDRRVRQPVPRRVREASTRPRGPVHGCILVLVWGERVGVAQQGALLTGRYTGASFSYGHLKYKSLSANTVSRVLLQHV